VHERKKERKKRGVRADAAYKYTTKIKIAYNIYIYIYIYIYIVILFASSSYHGANENLHVTSRMNIAPF
jgi:hypothetical protein